jgi:6-phosphogluconate dehydrogenase (decarboxylating)
MVRTHLGMVGLGRMGATWRGAVMRDGHTCVVHNVNEAKGRRAGRGGYDGATDHRVVGVFLALEVHLSEAEVWRLRDVRAQDLERERAAARRGCCTTGSA